MQFAWHNALNCMQVVSALLTILLLHVHLKALILKLTFLQMHNFFLIKNNFHPQFASQIS